MQYLVCYPEGKFKALTLSYDDGKIADRRLINLFNRYGIKGTFHLNGGLFPDLNESGDLERIPSTEVMELYKDHEVAAHTYTHPTIERCPLPVVIDEVLKDRHQLEQLVGYPVQGFSYPNGSFTQEIKNLLPSLAIEYARVVGDSHHFKLPTDWYEWKATCHHSQQLMKHAKDFVELDKPQYLYLMYVWGHSYEFDRDDNWELMESFSQFIGNRQDIWYCTNIEFKRYIADSQRIVFSVEGDYALNPSSQTIWYKIGNQIKALEPGITFLSKKGK